MNTYFLDLLKKDKQRKRIISLEFKFDVAPNKFTPDYIKERYPQIRNNDLIRNNFINRTYYWENNQYYNYVSIRISFHPGQDKVHPLQYYHIFQHAPRGSFRSGSELKHKINMMKPGEKTIKWGKRKINIRIYNRQALEPGYCCYGKANNKPIIIVKLGC
jgi:hypothetical protein